MRKVLVVLASVNGRYRLGMNHRLRLLGFQHVTLNKPAPKTRGQLQLKPHVPPTQCLTQILPQSGTIDLDRS